MTNRSGFIAAIAIFSILVMTLLARPSAAQCTGHWLPGDGVPGVFGTVSAIATLPGGDLLIGGMFSAAGISPVNNIAGYNPTTGAWSAPDTTLNGSPLLSNFVTAVIALPNGDAVVAGQFLSADVGISVVRYSPGADRWSMMGNGLSNPFSTPIPGLFALPDGDVLACGQFPFGGGTNKYALARYHTSTDTWTSLGQASPYSIADTCTIAPNGDMFVLGEFSSDGYTGSALARYDLVTDQLIPISATFWNCHPFAPPASHVYTLNALPSGDLLVGGVFCTVGNSSSNSAATSLATYNPATDTWLGVTGLADSSSVEVRSTTVPPNSEIIVAGKFQTAGNIPSPNIARFNPTTLAWFSLGAFGTVNFPVSATAALPDGGIITGGTLGGSGIPSPSNIARYTPATNSWSALSSGTDGPPIPRVLPNGQVYVLGSFTTLRGTPFSGIARYEPSTGAFLPVPGLDPSDRVLGITSLPSGVLIAVGLFHFPGGTDKGARFDPDTGIWSGLNWQFYIDQTTDVRAFPDGDVLVINEYAGRNLVRWHPDTNTWTPLNYGADVSWAVPRLSNYTMLPNGDLAVAAWFSDYTGSVDRFNTATGAWTQLLYFDDATSFSAPLAGLQNGDLVVNWSGGLTRFDHATNTPTSLGPSPDGLLYSLAVLPDGNLVALGNFTHIGGIAADSFARYNPSTGAWSPLGPGLNGPSSLAVLPSGDILAGGNFSTAGGQISAYFARYTFRANCPADFDCSGTLAPLDILTFLDAWFAANPRADFNNTGGIGVQDIFDFLNAWFIGC